MNTKHKILDSIFEDSRRKLDGYFENFSSKQIQKTYKFLIWSNVIGDIIKIEFIESVN